MALWEIFINAKTSLKQRRSQENLIFPFSTNAILFLFFIYILLFLYHGFLFVGLRSIFMAHNPHIHDFSLFLMVYLLWLARIEISPI